MPSLQQVGGSASICLQQNVGLMHLPADDCAAANVQAAHAGGERFEVTSTQLAFVAVEVCASACMHNPDNAEAQTSPR